MEPENTSGQVEYGGSYALLLQRVHSLIRTFGPVSTSGPAGGSIADELDVEDASMWPWFALRGLVRSLMTVGSKSFEDLCTMYEHILVRDREAPDAAASTLVDALQRWSERSNLSADTAFTFRMMVHFEAANLVAGKFGHQRSDASEALSRWEVWADATDGMVLKGPPAFCPPANPPIFHLNGWDATTISRARYEAAERERFEKPLAGYTEQCIARRSVISSEPVPNKRRPQQHSDWYIRYQVLEETFSDIAETDFKTKSAVSSAVHGVVNITGMPLRNADKGGAPRKPRMPVVKTVKSSPPR